MNAVREHAKFYVWLIASAALTGCAAPSGQSSVTASGVFASIDGGAAQIDPDTLNDSLEVEEFITPAIRLGLGYQFNSIAAIEFRAGDLGTVEFTDGRELGYQVVDASGLLQWRHRNASIFGRLGVGTFINDGDFDVELETPVHPVVGGGLAYHITPNVDVRLSVSAHGADAVVGNAGLVWRFGGNRRVRRVPTVSAPSTSNENDGFQAVAPVQTEELAEESLTVTPVAPRGGVENSGLLIDEKPIPTLQTFPEPVVPDEVTASLQQTTEPVAPVSAPEPEPQAIAAPQNITEEPESVAIPDNSPEELYVVDTLLPIRALQFDQGVASLLDSSLSDLDQVVDTLNANPELRLQVESHAAPIGNEELNMLLSRRRALTVIRLLVERGIEARRLRPRAFGDTAPVANAESINENDRVEFRIR